MKKETVFLISMVIALLLAIPGYKFFTASDTVKQEDGIKFPDEQETSSLFDSKTDTTGVGTRIAMPSSFPSNCGIILPIARAAPVLVGIIFKAAALARRKSL